MLEDLWMQKFRGPALSLLLFLSSTSDRTPPWFLQGFIVPECAGKHDVQIKDGDIWTVVVYGESDFLSGRSKVEEFERLEEEVTEAERQMVYANAAKKAVVLAVRAANYQEVGELWLKHHPECRDSACDDLAIIRAALMERADVMSDEEYEAW